MIHKIRMPNMNSPEAVKPLHVEFSESDDAWGCVTLKDGNTYKGGAQATVECESVFVNPPVNGSWDGILLASTGAKTSFADTYLERTDMARSTSSTGKNDH